MWSKITTSFIAANAAKLRLTTALCVYGINFMRTNERANGNERTAKPNKRSKF